MHFISVAIGMLGMAVFTLLYFIDKDFVGLSGLIYMLMGPAHGMHGARYGKARSKLIAAQRADAS